MKNRVISISLAVVLALSLGFISCGGEPVSQYSLTISSTEGGSVTAPGEGTFTYGQGKKVNLTAKPDEGYQFVNWSGDIGTVANVNAAATNITMDSDHSITANFEKGEVVVFPDANLEVAVREAIGKPTGSIFASDLEGLTSLDAAARNISSLSGLEHCTSLGTLDLYGNQITDISPLANLTNLSTINLGSNQVGDISALANLTNLQVLHLLENQVSDISSLANLTKLTTLYLGNNQISNILALTNLTKMNELHLDGNQISNISSLANMTWLVRLFLNSNQISDISPLANLTNLQGVSLDENLIEDISPLVQNEGFGQMDIVTLRQNPLSSDSFNIYIPQLQARGASVMW